MSINKKSFFLLLRQLEQALCAQFLFAQQPGRTTVLFFTMPSVGSSVQDLTSSEYCRWGFSKNKDTKMLTDTVTFVFHWIYWKKNLISYALGTLLPFSQVQQWPSVAHDGQVQRSLPPHCSKLLLPYTIYSTSWSTWQLNVTDHFQMAHLNFCSCWHYFNAFFKYCLSLFLSSGCSLHHMPWISVAVLPTTHLEILLCDLQPLSGVIPLYLRLLDANVDPPSARRSIRKGHQEMCHCAESYAGQSIHWAKETGKFSTTWLNIKE